MSLTSRCRCSASSVRRCFSATNVARRLSRDSTAFRSRSSSFASALASALACSHQNYATKLVTNRQSRHWSHKANALMPA